MFPRGIRVWAAPPVAMSVATPVTIATVARGQQFDFVI